MSATFLCCCSLGLLRFLFRLRHDVIDLLRRQITHLHHGVRLDDRQIVVRKITLLHEPLSKFLVDTVQVAETGDRSIDLFLQFFGGHDLDVPAAELAGQPHILATPPDGQRQLVFPHQHNCTAKHVAQENLVDVRRLQRVGDQDLRIFVPTHDVNSFARQFVHDVFDAVATDAHTRADAIHSLIRTAHGHLAAIAGLARHGIHADHAVGDFRYLLFKQPPYQARASPAKHHFHTTALRLDFVNDRTHSFVRMMRFSRNLFASRQDRFDVGQRNHRGAAVATLDDTADHIVNLSAKLLD